MNLYVPHLTALCRDFHMGSIKLCSAPNLWLEAAFSHKESG